MTKNDKIYMNFSYDCVNLYSPWPLFVCYMLIFGYREETSL